VTRSLPLAVLILDYERNIYQDLCDRGSMGFASTLF
jgi:hypothetical protein